MNGYSAGINRVAIRDVTVEHDGQSIGPCGFKTRRKQSWDVRAEKAKKNRE